MRRFVLSAAVAATLVLPAGAAAQGLAPYQSFARSGTTALGETDDSWSFAAGDLNRDGASDLWAIHRSGASNSTELHVLDAATNYQTFLLQTGTALHQTDANWSFAVADRNADGALDLWGINRSGASGKTEVHVLDGASGFTTFNTHAATALHPTPSGWDFGVADVDRDGTQDLVGISRSGGSGTTEVHALGGRTAFDAFVLQTPTALPPTPDARWTFGVTDASGRADVYAIDRQDPATSRTSVHVLSAADGYRSFSLETPTVLGPTDASWSFVPTELAFGPPAELVAVHRGPTTATAVLDGALAAPPAPDPSPARCAPGATTLTAALRTKTVRFGARPVVRGRLVNGDGSPGAGASVEVSTGYQRWAPTATTTTGADGNWSLRLPAGPTRPLYAAVGDGDSTPVCSTTLVQRVRAGVALKRSRRAVRNRQRVRFTGTLRGDAAARRRVDVQGYEPRKRRWITIDTVRTGAKGAFRTSYRFTTVRRRTTYRFRALVRDQTGFPFSRAASKTVKVRVRP